MSNAFNLAFGLSQQEDGKQFPAMIISSGTMSATLVMSPENVQDVIKGITVGLEQANEQARIANGGLIVTAMNPDALTKYIGGPGMNGQSSNG